MCACAYAAAELSPDAHAELSRCEAGMPLSVRHQIVTTCTAKANDEEELWQLIVAKSAVSSNVSAANLQKIIFCSYSA